LGWPKASVPFPPGSAISPSTSIAHEQAPAKNLETDEFWVFYFQGFFPGLVTFPSWRGLAPASELAEERVFFESFSGDRRIVNAS
jgi:hypothetical protein